MRRSLSVQANAQARHGAAAHRDRLALARSLDHAAALPRAHPPSPEPRPDPNKPRRSGHSRAPQHCTVGYGYYPDSHQRIPTLRLRGRWLEQLGFTIGSKLHIRMRNGELVVSVAVDGGMGMGTKIDGN
ncbi:SymE family type I addiction module toxin [Xanthomonas arboricola]|uniref:SymE family type I addiction module toxin n=1 Tax=Xanthomonas arboricola TaxID=56448 RepID=UPI000ADA7B9B|nr:SymE family type I addiction module toxin [Xanthomonas arboricola]